MYDPAICGIEGFSSPDTDFFLCHRDTASSGTSPAFLREKQSYNFWDCHAILIKQDGSQWQVVWDYCHPTICGIEYTTFSSVSNLRTRYDNLL